MVKGTDIRMWMLKQRIHGADIARVLGVSPSYVCHYLAGRRKGALIRDWLLEHGCPAKYLGEDGKQAA